MEWNGVKYDLEKSKKLGEELRIRSKDILGELSDIYPMVPVNWNSPDHVSASLYGGVVKVDIREDYEFVYKDGRSKIKERIVTKKYEMPRLVEPLKGSQLVKEGYWSTAEDTLRGLRANKKAKKIIGLILELSSLETKMSRYYFGIPEKYEELGWQSSIIHGQLNQVVTKTGRLSSSNPNMQNLDSQAKICFISRF